MRLAPGLLFMVVLAGCTSTSATATDGGAESGGGGGQGVMSDAPPANSCETYAPTGSVCRGGGVCGTGYALSQLYLCAESTKVCCTPAVDGGVPTGDASLTSDAGDDAKVIEAGHDATMTGHDAGHDSGMTTHMDAGHDAGHDSGMTTHMDAGHDAGHDSGMTTHMDAGHDSGATDAQDGAAD